ncbi:MAG: signal peptidase I [Anaerolineae bacterium]|jgi:signal peptidase I
MIETADHRKDRLRPRLARPGFWGELVRTVVFVFVVTVLFDMVIPRSLVEGRSMQPTFETNDRLIVSRLHYMLGRPQRGDIVVFNSINPREPTTMLIKRVIGLPGETVSFVDNQVYINGVRLSEPYVANVCTRCVQEPVTLGPDEYYVLGDNRPNSVDSRSFGVITIRDIVGEAVFRYWPPAKFGLIMGHAYSE